MIRKSKKNFKNWSKISTSGVTQRSLEGSATKIVPNVPRDPAISFPNRALLSLRASSFVSFLAFQSFVNKRGVFPFPRRVFLSVQPILQSWFLMSALILKIDKLRTGLHFKINLNLFLVRKEQITRKISPLIGVS